MMKKDRRIVKRLLVFFLTLFMMVGIVPHITTYAEGNSESNMQDRTEDYVRAYKRPATASTAPSFPDYNELSVQVGDQTLQLYYSAWRNIGQFEYTGTPTVTITAPVDIDSVSIYPSPYGIETTIDGAVCTFEMPEMGSKQSKFAVNITDKDGKTYQVDLYGDPVEEDKPDPNDPNVYYFAARDEVYTPGVDGYWNIENEDNKTIYIEEGAVVKARINIINSDNFTVKGRGVLTDSRTERSVSPVLAFYDSENVTVQDITMGVSNYYMIKMVNVQGGEIRNVKENAAVGNTDGITITSGSNDILVDDCFLAVNDDSLVLNIDSADQDGTDNITYQNLVIANRTNGYKFSFRCYTYGVAKNITFNNIYCIQSPGTYGFMKTSYTDTCGIWLQRVENLSFENIYIENTNNRTLMDFTSMTVSDGEVERSSLTEYGHITFKNVYHENKPTISAPSNVYIVMDHCTYGASKTPIASASDMQSVSGTVEYVSGDNTPTTFVAPVTQEIPAEEIPSTEGEFIKANETVSLTGYNRTASNLQVKWVETGTTYLSSTWKRNSYIKFDLSDTDMEEVTVARLWLHSDYFLDVWNGNVPVDVYEAVDDWTAESISRPGPELTTLLDSMVVHEYGWVSFDITPAVANALEDGTLLSLGLRHKTENSRSYNEFSGVDDNNPPYVELVYYEDGAPVTGVSLDIGEYRMPKDRTLQLTETIEPYYATNKNVIWSSSDSEIASVDENGLVTSHKEGYATITATTVDGNYTASAVIEVGTYKTYIWDFSEWGSYSSTGKAISADYVLGQEYDYNNLMVNFSNSSDRINLNAWGIYFRYSYSSSYPSYLAYTPKQSGTLTLNGKAIQIREGSTSGTVVAANTNASSSIDITVALEAGKTYYVICTENASGRVTYLQYEYPITIDKSELEEVILSAEELQIGRYTEASWAILQEGLTTGKQVYDNEAASQEEVDQAIVQLQSSIDLLEEKGVQVVTIPWDFNEWGEFTSSGVSLTNGYTLGQEFDYKGLTIVFANSNDRINRGAYGVFFQAAYGTSHSYIAYTPDYDGTLTINGKAIQIREGSPTGTKVADSPSSTGSYDFSTELKAGVTYYIISTGSSGRVVYAQYEYLIDVDKSELETLIQNIEGLQEEEYTEISWNDLQNALSNAKEIYADETASQDQVMEACENLKAAFDKLEPIPVSVPVDKTSLIELVELISAVDSTLYTPESWEAVSEALNKANTTLDDLDAVQEVVDETCITLKAAFDALVPIETDIEADSISITNGSLINLNSGNTVQLTVSFNPPNITNTELAYQSSNESVATVSEDGLVTGVTKGMILITAITSNGKTAVIIICVK